MLARVRSYRPSAAMVVAFVALFFSVGGVGYALRGIPDRNGVFHGCVSNKSGALRVVKSAASCQKPNRRGRRRTPGEFAVTWNQQGPQGGRGPLGGQGPQGQPGIPGPQGPGAKELVYDASGTASPPMTTVGTMGAYTLTASCSESGSTTDLRVFATGPSTRIDGYEIIGGTAGSESLSEPPLSNVQLRDVSSSSTVMAIDSGSLLFTPSSGTAFEVMLTFVATGGATNTCHFAANVIPTS